MNAHDTRRYRKLQAVVAVLVAALVLAAGGYLGYHAAYSGMGMDLDAQRYRSMEAELPRLQEQVSSLQGELDVQTVRNSVDRQALEMVRQEITSQKEQISALEEGLRFYKSLMAPGEIAQGLSLRLLELVPMDQPNHFAFRIVVQQEARKHALLKGEISADVVGVLAGESVSYSLAELSDDVDGVELPLRFRYFQSIEGELVLPEGFEPMSVSLVATASTPGKAEVREQFPWRIQERFTHVGK